MFLGMLQVGLVPEEGDIIWTPRTTLTYPAMCSIAGIVAGMFGVGGGIVKAPLMLTLGVLPDVAAATSATMILFTSGACLSVAWHCGWHDCLAALVALCVAGAALHWDALVLPCLNCAGKHGLSNCSLSLKSLHVCMSACLP